MERSTFGILTKIGQRWCDLECRGIYQRNITLLVHGKSIIPATRTLSLSLATVFIRGYANPGVFYNENNTIPLIAIDIVILYTTISS